MKVYLLKRQETHYLVGSSLQVYFYSKTREKFMPTKRSYVDLLARGAKLVANNYQPNFMNKAFAHVK